MHLDGVIFLDSFPGPPGPAALGEWKTSVPSPPPCAWPGQPSTRQDTGRQGRQGSSECRSGQFGHLRVAWSCIGRNRFSLGRSEGKNWQPTTDHHHLRGTFTDSSYHPPKVGISVPVFPEEVGPPLGWLQSQGAKSGALGSDCLLDSNPSFCCQELEPVT